jgi:citronellol/citronellal dehydrogenase
VTAAVLAPGSLAGRRAVVTGAGTGIGRGIALRLVELGAEVVGVGRRIELLEETAGLAGPSFVPRALDIRDGAAVHAFCAGLERLDLLVNNAGGQFLAPADEISDRGFAAVLDLNLTAVARLTELCRPLLTGGTVVVVTVSGAERGVPGMSHSATARAAIIGLARDLAGSWPEGRVYCLAPGTVLTPAMRAELTQEALDQVLAGTPLGRDTAVEEVAEWVAALACGIAPGSSGALIELDGGAGLHGVPGALLS